MDKYKQFIVGFKKADGDEYKIRIYATYGAQAVRIASTILSGKFGEGDFYFIEETTNED